METNVFIVMNEVRILTYIKKQNLVVVQGLEYTEDNSLYSSKPCVVTLSKKTFLDLQNQFFEWKNRYFVNWNNFAGSVHPTYAEDFQLTGTTSLLTGFDESDDDFEEIYEEVNIYHVSKFEEVDMEHG